MTLLEKKKWRRRRKGRTRRRTTRKKKKNKTKKKDGGSREAKIRNETLRVQDRLYKFRWGILESKTADIRRPFCRSDDQLKRMWKHYSIKLPSKKDGHHET